jgi:hypothetical protein
MNGLFDKTSSDIIFHTILLPCNMAYHTIWCLESEIFVKNIWGLVFGFWEKVMGRVRQPPNRFVWGFSENTEKSSGK